MNDSTSIREGCCLHLCAAEGKLKILKFLLDKLGQGTEKSRRALTAKAGRNDETPLYMAVLRGQRRVVELLCSREMDVNQRTRREKSSALMIAALFQMEDPELWRPIVKREDLRLDTANQKGNTVFHEISQYDSQCFDSESPATFLKELLERCGCAVSLKAFAAKGAEEIEEDVVAEVAALYNENRKHTWNEANDSHVINLLNHRNCTPLHAALDVTLVSGANLYGDDLHAPTYIVQSIPIQFSRLLISAGADIHATDTQGQNALHRACSFPKNSNTMEILLECFWRKSSKDRGSEFKIAKSRWENYACTQDFYGQTPLHLAAKYGNVEAIYLLLDHSKNGLIDHALVDKLISMRDSNDKTILHFAATQPHPFTLVDAEKKKLEIQKFVCKRRISGSALPLLIWSEAQEIGLAEEWAKKSSYNDLANTLKSIREKSTENLLGLALSSENYDMAVELLNRGAIMTKEMLQHIDIEGLLKDMKKQQEYLDKKLNKFKDAETCTKLGKGCLISFYEARKAQVVEKIERLKKDEGRQILVQLKVLKKIIEGQKGRTTDQPTHEDLLEREDIKSSISALLLNQHMGSPITLGILGSTGMGKSSMMLQVEHNLLSKATKETLSLALPTSSREPRTINNFTGAKKESAKSKIRATKILNELQKLIPQIKQKRKFYHAYQETIDLRKDKEKPQESIGWKRCLLLPRYILKSLTKVKAFLTSKLEYTVAFTNLTSKLEYTDLSKRDIASKKIEDYISNFDEEKMWLIKRLALANDGTEVPTLMTVRFNAWQYESRDEAWAGLAVEILKAMESCMTKARLFNASFMYSYKKNPSNAVVQLIIPIFIYLIIGGIVGWVSFTLFSIPNSPFLKSFGYASVPISVLASIWQVLGQVSKYAKPVSEKFMETTKSMQVEHLSKLGYQHRVIEDINFLRDRLTCTHIPIAWLWRLGAWILNITSASTFLADGVIASDALKYTPQRENFRIIVFIDNLDRRKEKLFTPLNMILKACDINAVVAIDKESVEDVIDTRDQGAAPTNRHEEVVLLKDALLQQLIQIPIVLPEPDIYELCKPFLEEHLKDFETLVKKDRGSNKEDPNDKLQDGQSIPQGAHNSIEVEDCTEVNKGDENSLKNNDTSTNIFKTEIMPSDGTNEIIEDAQKENIWLEMKVNVLDSNYNRGEIKAFKHLVNHTYGYYRSPRAWKGLLNYHRLIRSLITYNYQHARLSAWKPQLVIWVFFCWQWRKQMNEIFKNWQSLTVFPLEELKYRNLLVDLQQLDDLKKVLTSEFQASLLKQDQYKTLWDSINAIYPTLMKIMEKHRIENISQNKVKEEATNKEESLGEEMEAMKAEYNSTSSDLHREYPSPKHDSSKEIQNLPLEKQKKEEKPIEESDVEWARLFKALKVGEYDVTMQGIQTFQKFRFDCDPGNLKLHVK